jgi:hypothetical protein
MTLRASTLAVPVLPAGHFHCVNTLPRGSVMKMEFPSAAASIATRKQGFMFRLLLNWIHPRHLWFPLVLAFIAVVSLYDTWLIARFEESITIMEQNPFGRWLLNVNDGRADVFIRVKLAGTIVVLSTLLMLRWYRSRVVVPVTTSIGSFQAGLLYYLTMV